MLRCILSVFSAQLCKRASAQGLWSLGVYMEHRFKLWRESFVLKMCSSLGSKVFWPNRNHPFFHLFPSHQTGVFEVYNFVRTTNQQALFWSLLVGFVNLLNAKKIATWHLQTPWVVLKRRARTSETQDVPICPKRKQLTKQSEQGGWRVLCPHLKNIQQAD